MMKKGKKVVSLSKEMQLTKETTGFKITESKKAGRNFDVAPTLRAVLRYR